MVSARFLSEMMKIPRLNDFHAPIHSIRLRVNGMTPTLSLIHFKAIPAESQIPLPLEKRRIDNPILVDLIMSSYNRTIPNTFKKSSFCLMQRFHILDVGDTPRHDANVDLS